jgi:hypothetical protein
VIADSIRSLQIVTKTHELYLEEAPEEFTVRAYDDQGNEFRYHGYPLMTSHLGITLHNDISTVLYSKH